MQSKPPYYLSHADCTVSKKHVFFISIDTSLPTLGGRQSFSRAAQGWKMLWGSDWDTNYFTDRATYSMVMSWAVVIGHCMGLGKREK